MTAIDLNEGQTAAADALFRFLISKDKEFSISGPAGTGKTTLMNHVVTHLLPSYEEDCKLLGIKPVNYEVALTATTNKATEVLAAATGKPAQTIHSFMNLKVKDNFKTGESEIVPTPAFVVHTRKLIFVDEASMIDSKLYRYIQKGTDKTCKIIYLGDHCQMAPVFETLSPVYAQAQNTAVLAQPMRNAGQPALVSLCNRLRNTVETLDFFQLPETPGVVDYVSGQDAFQFIQSTFGQENLDARVLCYTNARVQEYNEHIRTLRGYPEHFTPGETVVNSSAIQIRNGQAMTMLRIEEELFIKSVAPQTETVVLDEQDPNSTFEAYEVELVTPGKNLVRVKVPLDPERFKALSRYYARVKDWNTFFKMKNTYPDLRPRDACTVYKAQGSTYDTVFLDLTNIGSCTQEDQLARMLYVGASRARNRLVLFGKLPDRLFKKAA